MVIRNITSIVKKTTLLKKRGKKRKSDSFL